jgi:hypothetical protein
VAAAYGVNVTGVSRQAAWIDVDNDRDLDLFVAFRDQPNRRFRNDGKAFTDVTDESGIGDPRKSFSPPRRTIPIICFATTVVDSARRFRRSSASTTPATVCSGWISTMTALSIWR